MKITPEEIDKDYVMERIELELLMQELDAQPDLVPGGDVEKWLASQQEEPLDFDGENLLDVSDMTDQELFEGILEPVGSFPEWPGSTGRELAVSFLHDNTVLDQEFVDDELDDELIDMHLSEGQADTIFEAEEMIDPFSPEMEPEQDFLDNSELEVFFSEIDRLFASKADEPEPERGSKTDGEHKKRRSVASMVSSMLFYLVVIGAVIMAFISTGKIGGKPRDFFGYSYFTVFTSSMQSEIPKGSFIITKKTNPNELQIGDNITFLESADTTVTHKIVDIYENYESGERGFQTQGVNNAGPDANIVLAANVVGKVIFSLPSVGALLEFLNENMILVIVFFALALALSFSLQVFFRIRKEEKTVMKRQESAVRIG